MVRLQCASLVLLLLAWSMSGASAVPPYWWTTYPPDVQTRRELAKAWLEGISKVERSVPTLSPEQRAWLKTEYDDEIKLNAGKLTKRALEASNSLEYQIATAKPQLEELKKTLTTLATNSPSDPTEEVVLWTAVANRFMDQSLWQAVANLVRRGILDKNINGVDSFYFENHVMWAQMVLQSVVKPMLIRMEVGHSVGR
jgi:hypothetical protein